MTRFALAVTLGLITGFPAHSDSPAATAITEGDTGAAQLPADVALRVADLWAYGDRYEAAIRGIEAANATPDWGWGSDCHDIVLSATIAPGS